MRLFIAVYPSDEAIAKWERFKTAAPKSWPLRWTPAASLHFTLKFLGQTEPTLGPKINACIERVAGITSPFSLSLQSGGVFPEKGSPAIFWAGATEDVGPLTELAHVLELEFKNLGFPAENRPYHPHLTVARPSDKNTRLPATIGRDFQTWTSGFSTNSFVVNQINLVESHLGPTSATYTVLRTFPLKSI